MIPEPMNGVERAVESIWQRQAAWSGAASALKRRITRIRTTALVLGIVGAALETAAATLLGADASRARMWLAIAGAVALAAGTYVTRLLGDADMRAWTRARSVSETIKAAVWKFRAGAAPYTGRAAAQRLAADVSAVERQAADLEHHVARVVVTPKPAPPALAPGEYIEQRVMGQSRGFYRPSALRLATRLSRLRALELALGLLATCVGAAAAYLSSAVGGVDAARSALGAWVAVLTTMSGSIAAHIAASRYAYLSMSYSATARRLEQLVEAYRMEPPGADPDRWSRIVEECENAISAENESWLARFARAEPAADRPPELSGPPTMTPASARSP